MLMWSLIAAFSLLQSPTVEAGRISGRVTLSGTGAPVSSARITVFPSRPSGPFGPPPQAITGPDGRFTFDQIAPGTYRVDAQKAGFAPLDDAVRPTVTVTAGQSTDVNLQLQRGAAITGKVLDPSGEPLTDARVMVLRRTPVPAGVVRGLPAMPRLIPASGSGAQTNDLGEFRVAGLAPGEYFVAVSPRSVAMFGPAGSSPVRDQKAARTTLPTTYYPGTTDQAAAQPIAVAAGAEVGNIFLTMQPVPAFRVSGIVVDEDGKAVGDAMVMLMGDPRSGAMAMGAVGNSVSRADGQFDIDAVPAGTYRANASIIMRGGGAGGGTGAVSVGASGDVASSGGSFSWSSASSTGGAFPQPTEVVVGDADITNVKVVVRRPAPR
jgi:protocatechuate 3,4-dioxygenase beta subunit